MSQALPDPQPIEQSAEAAGASRRPPSFGEAFRYWLKLGCTNFGGPTAQIAVLHHDLVEERRWISNDRFLHALNYCMLLPGPEAQQLATYIGWLLHRTRGGLVAGTLFVLPGFVFMLALSWIYAAHGDIASVGASFYGLRAAVIGVVAAATLRIGTKALKNRAMQLVAALAFVGIFFFHIPFPAIVLGAALIGLIGARLRPALFLVASDHGASAPETVLRDDAPAAAHQRPSWRRALVVLVVGLVVWWGPLAAVIAWRGSGDVLSQEALYFSKAAMVTFGGAYAVLSYINQAVVQTFGWLEPGQMVTGLGLAETTPGPLILVTEFVGFLAAYRNPAGLHPIAAGVLGALVTTWATFAPCFLWIFLGAPFIEHLRGNRALSAALSTITAAVVGVILNLAVWFSIQTLFREVGERTWFAMTIPVPRFGSLDPFACVVASVAFVGLWRLKWNLIATIATSAGAGLVWKLLV